MLRSDVMIDFNEQGLAYIKEKRYEDAAQAFNQAIENDPKNPIGYTNFGNLLIGIHESEKAIAFFEKALDLDENYGAAQYGLGNAFFENKQTDLRQ